MNLVPNLLKVISYNLAFEMEEERKLSEELFIVEKMAEVTQKPFGFSSENITEACDSSKNNLKLVDKKFEWTERFSPSANK